MKTCPICSSKNVLRLEEPFEVPILMNRVYGTASEARAARTGSVELFGCVDCSFVWNVAFRSEIIVYDHEYENDQTHSPAFAAHLAGQADSLVRSVPDGEGIRFLEVGCGQGRFMEAVASAAGDRIEALEGFDPAWRGNDGDASVDAAIHACYLDESTKSLLKSQPNVVASRHTIEHVPDPVDFLTTIRSAVGESTGAIFIETPCVAWILRNEAFQDFFYEHCSLFSRRSLALALSRSGFGNPRVSHVFGGQYLWAAADLARSGAPGSYDLDVDIRAVEGHRKSFALRWSRRMRELAKAHGNVAIWGAGAKGVMFSLLCDPKCEILSHAIDVNPMKQGRYLPGTGLAIRSPEDEDNRRLKVILVMNPNYLAEIREQVGQLGFNAQVVPIN